VAVVGIASGKSGWAVLLMSILLTAFPIILAPLAMKQTIRVDATNLRFKTFRHQKVVSLTSIVHVSSRSHEHGPIRPFTIYSKEGVIQLDGLFHSPGAFAYLRKLLNERLGRGILRDDYDLRDLDQESRRRIEREKVSVGGRALAATAWSREYAVLSSGVFLIVFIWMTGSGAVFQYMAGKMTEFYLLTIFTAGFSSVFGLILGMMIKLRRFEFKVYASTTGADIKWVVEAVLGAQGLRYMAMRRNRVPCPYWFDYVWKVDDDWLIRVKVMQGTKGLTYWVSVGPKVEGNSAAIMKTKDIFDVALKSIV
jgi:hypothetical protein